MYRDFVFFHKPCNFPFMSENQVPIQCGGRNLGYLSDNTGRNISEKNSLYSELSGMYWVWKNYGKIEDVDYYGFSHYGRYIVSINKPFTEKEITNMLGRYDVIVPRAYRFTNATAEAVFMVSNKIPDGLSTLRECLPKEYVPAFDNRCKAKSGHYCNLFICNKENFNDYCKFLFSTLSRVERRLGDKYLRLYGYLGEFLLDIWIETNHKTFVEGDFWVNGNINHLDISLNIPPSLLSGGK